MESHKRDIYKEERVKYVTSIANKALLDFAAKQVSGIYVEVIAKEGDRYTATFREGFKESNYSYNLPKNYVAIQISGNEEDFVKLSKLKYKLRLMIDGKKKVKKKYIKILDKYKRISQEIEN